MLFHKGSLSLVHPSDVLLLLLLALESTDAVREAKPTVVVDSIDRVRINLVEAGEVHAESIALNEEYVLGINSSDSGHNAVVERKQTSPFRIGWLVHRVVSSNPWISAVTLRDVLP